MNEHTQPVAPPEAMQFGHVLPRLLHRIRYADRRHGPVYQAKVDLADGFYRINLEVRTAPALAIILPHSPGESMLVAVPLALPMGWVESPPSFCSMTETIADVANATYMAVHLPTVWRRPPALPPQLTRCHP